MTNALTEEYPIRDHSGRNKSVQDVNVDGLVAITSTSKTWSRMLVEKFLIHFKWYNPNVGKTGDDVPDLRKAWAYYEHVTLARYHVNDGDRNRFDRADPGEMEKPTELYPYFRLPMKQLNDWGIGVGLYFTELRAMMIILFCAGLISLSNILYFSGVNLSFQKEKYRHDMTYTDLSYLITGSAVCNEWHWVACEPGWCDVTTINKKNQDRVKEGKEPKWNITTVSVLNEGDITLVKRRACDGAIYKIGMTNYAAVLFLIFASLLFLYYIGKRTMMLDEDNVTASDYSIVVKNPPPLAYNPEEWKEFFTKFADKQVSVCTICLDNAALVRSLLKRRIVLKQIRSFLPNVNFDEEKEFEKALDAFASENPSKNDKLSKLVTRLKFITEEVKMLQKKEYKVKRVFLTFETEQGQRTALAALKAGKIPLWAQMKTLFTPETLFKDKALFISEAEEPSTIRYLDLQVGYWTSFIQSSSTLFLTIAIIALSDFLIVRARGRNRPFLAGYLTTAFNSLFPFVLKRLMMAFEQHKSESTWQASLYLRLTLFRWVNTAILARILIPADKFLGTGKADLLPAMSAILLSELWLSPLLSYLDLYGTFMKHVIAPRASNQDQMNLSFKGSYYNLAERYTSFTTIVFLCYMYCALNPLSFFICGGILLIQFQMDKFALTRTWYSAPLIGTKISKLSRIYFLLALVVCVIVCSYDWSRFRYDNICVSGWSENQRLPIWKNATDGQILDKPPVWTNATDPTIFDSRLHRVCNSTTCCNQSIRNNGKKPVFPLVPRFQPSDFKWMTSTQERLSSVYGWTSVAFLVIFLLIGFGYQVTSSFVSLFHGIVSKTGQDQQIDFSCTGERGYVPQHWMFQFDYNLIACEMDGVDADLIGWHPPTGKSYDDFNIIFDVPYDGMKRKRNKSADADSGKANESKSPIFSIVKRWPVSETVSN